MEIELLGLGVSPITTASLSREDTDSLTPFG